MLELDIGDGDRIALQLQERERAVRQLESDILDVNTIFKVLSHIHFWRLKIYIFQKLIFLSERGRL